LGGKLFSQTEPDGSKAGAHEQSHQLMVLTPQNQLEKYVSLENLVKYARQVTEVVQSNLLDKSDFVQDITQRIGDQSKQTSRQLVLQFDLHPTQKLNTDTSRINSGLDLKVAFRPVVDQQDVLNRVRLDVLSVITPIQTPSVEGLVQFQVYFPLV